MPSSSFTQRPSVRKILGVATEGTLQEQRHGTHCVPWKVFDDTGKIYLEIQPWMKARHTVRSEWWYVKGLVKGRRGQKPWLSEALRRRHVSKASLDFILQLLYLLTLKKLQYIAIVLFHRSFVTSYHNFVFHVKIKLLFLLVILKHTIYDWVVNCGDIFLINLSFLFSQLKIVLIL